MQFRGDGDAIVDVGERVRRLEVCQLRGGIAPHRVAVEVLVGEAEVGFVRVLVGIAELHVKDLVALASGFQAPLGVEGVADEAGVAAAVDFLEAGAAVAHAFDEERGSVEGPRVGALHLVEAVVADAYVHFGEGFVRHRPGNEIHGAADGVGAVADGCGALQHLHGVDSADVGNVVGGRR